MANQVAKRVYNQMIDFMVEEPSSEKMSLGSFITMLRGTEDCPSRAIVKHANPQHNSLVWADLNSFGDADSRPWIRAPPVPNERFKFFVKGYFRIHVTTLP